MPGFWQGIGEVLRQDFADLPDAVTLFRIGLRLLSAIVLGGVLGYERERLGKAAGLRTHMLVALAAAVFVLAAELAGMPKPDISRIVQGIATGIGFIGGGAILKLSERQEIRGLTTAAGIWLTTAVGISAGFGRIGLAAIGVVFAWVILTVLHRLERRLSAPSEAPPRNSANAGPSSPNASASGDDSNASSSPS